MLPKKLMNIKDVIKTKVNYEGADIMRSTLLMHITVNIHII